MPRPSKPDPEPIETRAEKFVAEEQARYSECMDRARAALAKAPPPPEVET